jgi:hypothetical protein
MRGGDLGARTDAVFRFSPSARRRRVILATGVRRESRRTMMAVGCSASPIALCGRSAEACGDDCQSRYKVSGPVAVDSATS